MAGCLIGCVGQGHCGKVGITRDEAERWGIGLGPVDLGA